MVKKSEYIREGVFFTFIDGKKSKAIEYHSKNYSGPVILSKIDKKSLKEILDGAIGVKFLGITTDQQLYRPGSEVHVLATALDYPGCDVKLVFRMNGVLLFDDDATLSSAGILDHVISSLDIGKYDVSCSVQLDDTEVPIGTATFEVAEFELDPFQVTIESQSMSERQILTANINVSVLHQPYSGPLDVGLYCSFCRRVVLRDKINCTNGKGVVSFNVSGHTAPFSLEFVAPGLGYTARIQLEGTMPHQRKRTPISFNLQTDYTMSLFPQTGSIGVQGVNIYKGNKNPASMFEVGSPVGDTVVLKVLKDTSLVAVSIYNPITKEISHLNHEHVKAGMEIRIDTGESHVIVFFAGVINKKLHEGFFVGFRSPEPSVELSVPERARSGEPIEISLKNQSGSNYGPTECLILVFDKRKVEK
ncbi:MAG: hypothetical protein ACTSXP_18600 [Promethearchaeota archaeon]